MATGFKLPQLSKSGLTMLKLLVVLVSMVATTAVFGQSSYVWTNQNPLLLNAPNGGDLNQGTNWLGNGPAGVNTDPNGVPRPDFQDGVTWGDEMMFNGLTTGPLTMTQNGNSQANGGGSGQPYGLRIHLTSAQTSPVTIISPVGVSGGMRMNYFAIDAGAGPLILGGHNGNCLDIVDGVLNGQVLGLTNNSSTPCEITEGVRWREGGAGAHPHIFTGTGDWIVNNHMRSANSSSIIVQKDGPGTMTWTGTNNANANFPDQLGSPISIFAGTMIWKTSDLVGGSAGNPNIAHNGALFKYDANDGGTAVIIGIISGTGPIEVHAGTLNLASANTITGNLMLSGGTLIAGWFEVPGASGPLGQNGTISFSGGTLQYSVNNAFDYSPRFDTSAGQAYRINTAGQTVTFSNNLASSGATFTKLGNGELVLAGASSYSGQTTVSGGTLTLQGPKTGSGNITVNDGADLDVFNNGTQVTPATLTLGSGVGANLDFDNVSSTATAPLAAGTIVAAGTTLISINSGTFTIGQSYPLLAWSSGSAPAVSLGIVDGAGGTLSTNGNTILFNCTSVAFIWSGANNGNWDTTTANNWTVQGSPTLYSDPNQVVFNDSVTGQTNVTMSGILQPLSLTINNATNPYTITSSAGNNLSGSIRLAKRGSGAAALSGGANANTGVTTVRGGTLIVSTLANGGAASDIGASSSAGTNLVLNGGGLQYGGSAASVDRLFTVGTSGGAIDVEGTGALNLNNPGAISHNGTLTLNGNTADTNTLAGALLGGGALIKNGTGTWVLTGTNGYGGGTTVANGVLQVGANGGTGSLGIGPVVVLPGVTLDFERTGTLTVPGAINGVGAVSQNGSGTVILANNNGYTGGTTINAGTLQVGNGGSSGSLFANGPIVNNSLLVFNTAGSFTYQAAGLISGSGNVIFTGGGTIKAIGNNSYTGWTRIDAGTTFFCREGQDGFLPSPVVTNSGTLRIVSQDTAFTYAGNIVANTNTGAAAGRVQIGANNVNVGVMTFTGTNTYTGGTFIGDNTLVLGDNLNPGAGAIAGNVQFVNNFTIAQDNPRTLQFNRPDDFTFGGTITTNFATPQVNLGIVQQNGSGTLTLTGNNTYGGGTVVAFGFLKVGNGGSSGSLGFGPVALNSGNPLVINRSGTMNPVDNVSGAADIYITGGATVTLNGANNTYSGVTTVSNGTLIVNGTNVTSSTTVYAGGFGGAGTFTGPVTLVSPTTFSPGAANSVGTLTVQNNLTVDSTNIVVDINKFAAPTSDFVNVTGTLTRNATGGTLTVHNRGPNDLVPGDTFTLFNQPLPNGALLTITGARATWVNNLAVNGSISVSTLITTVPTLNFTSTSTNLQFSWSDPYNSFKLQAKTNTLEGAWFDYPGGSASPIAVPISRANNEAFFRLISIP